VTVRLFQTIGLILVLTLIPHAASLRAETPPLPEQVPVSPEMREALREIHATGAYDAPNLPLKEDATMRTPRTT
jgi:hypothetical protein